MFLVDLHRRETLMLTLFMNNIPSLDVAFDLERLRLEQLGIGEDFIHFVLRKARQTVISQSAPVIPPEEKEHTSVYDVVQDVLWEYQDVSSHRGPVDLRWTIITTNVSNNDHIFRFHRHQYLKGLHVQKSEGSQG